MEFGISLPTDPPIGAQVEKARLAEARGFANVWCRDTHRREADHDDAVRDENMYTTFDRPERSLETSGRDVVPSMATVAH